MQEVLKYLHSGQRIYVAGSSNEPTGLLRDLAASALPEKLEFIQFPLPGLNQTDFTQFNDTASVTTFFMSSALAKGDAARVNYLPMQMRATYDYLATNLDVYLLQVAYDQERRLRVGPNLDFHDLLNKKRIVQIFCNFYFIFMPITSNFGFNGLVEG